MKKYYATFLNGKVSCFFERKDGEDFPSYLKKEDIKELTKEQYENINFLNLIDDQVLVDETKYQKKIKIEQKSKKKDAIANKIKKLTNLQISQLDAVKKDKLLIYLVDMVFDRDEILEDEPWG